MTALALRKYFNNLDKDFGRTFFNPAWYSEMEDTTSTKFPMSSHVKYDEGTSAWKLTLEIAGVTKENLKVDAKEGHLSVTGEKTKGLELGTFERYFRLPEGVDLEKIEAQFEDGVLTVTLPLQVQKQAKKIQIK